jgi:hypothetical protein
MTIGEYIKELEKFRKDLPKWLMAETMGTVGADIRAAVNVRVENRGERASGGRFTPYKKRKKGGVDR